MLQDLRYVAAWVQFLKCARQLSEIAQTSFRGPFRFLMPTPLNKKYYIVPDYPELFPRAILFPLLLELLN